MRDLVVKIRVDGHVDDLYALSLLFPEGHGDPGDQGRNA